VTDQPKIDTLSPCVKEAQCDADVCRTTYEGIEAMREAGTKYLPQNPREENDAYKVRLNRTDFFPALQRAVHAYVGKPLGSPIVVTDAPQVVEAALENIDLAGSDLDTWARCVFTDGLVDGLTFAVADYPKVPKGATLAQERALGARPYLIHIPLDRVIDYRAEVVGGVHRLVHFRYFECASVPDGPWGQKEVQRIRVLLPGSVEVWENTAQHGLPPEWVLVPDLSGPVSVTEVPVACFAPQREGWFDGEPPLAELAWLNVRWWQSKSEQNHILHAIRVPLLTADEDTRRDPLAPVSIGVDGLITGFKNLRYVEHNGKGIEAGRQDILDTEDAMRRVAGQMLVSESGQKSATEAALEGNEGSSQLRAWVCNFQDFLEESLRLMALWIKEPKGGTVQLDMEWDEQTVGADVLTALSTMRDKGQISRETFLANLQRADILPDGTTIDEEIARLEMEGPPSMPMKMPTGA
jgi:hypothetical protein